MPCDKSRLLRQGSIVFYHSLTLVANVGVCNIGSVYPTEHVSRIQHGSKNPIEDVSRIQRGSEYPTENVSRIQRGSEQIRERIYLNRGMS